MKVLRRILSGAAIVPLITSCLFKNDMSYPYIIGEIGTFSVEGQKSAAIDTKTRTVVVELDETADITKVRVVEAKPAPEPVARFAEDIPEVLDLSSPYVVTVSTYQDYRWTVSAVQPIERYVNCPQSSRKPLFNTDERTVLLYLLPDSNLSEVTIESMKLEKEGSSVVSTTGFEVVDGVPVEKTVEISEEDFPLTLDCTLERSFTVLCGGEEVVWKLSAVRVQGDLKIDMVAPWCWSADVTAEFGGEGEPYLEYRPVSSEEWTEMRDVSIDGLSVTAKLTGLSEGTVYAVRICDGGDMSQEYQFTTSLPVQIGNMGFNDWYTSSRGIWFPGTDGGEKIWDTANEGASTIGANNPTKPEYSFLAPSAGSEGVSAGNTAAARLESSLVLGMFAAGNIYTGDFGKPSIGAQIGAVLDWGTPFTSRPKALKGYYSYTPQQITNVKPPYEDLKGTTDKCQILVMLTDWDQPFTVDTSKGIFVDQDNDPHIIAYHKFESDLRTDGYVPFEFELEYRRPDATPKYAVVIACASYKGDFFTGGLGSVMYVDEFEFVYE